MGSDIYSDIELIENNPNMAKALWILERKQMAKYKAVVEQVGKSVKSSRIECNEGEEDGEGYYHPCGTCEICILIDLYRRTNEGQL